MIVRTKKFQMEKSQYIKKGFFNLLKEQWWVFIIYIGICGIYYFSPSVWWIIGGTIALFIYIIFWLIQFFGVTQVEQSSYMFGRNSYEISSGQIMMKISNKQGMPIKWDTIQKVIIHKDCFLFKLNIVQYIIFPFRVFNNENEIRFIKSILSRKGYVK